MIATQEDHTFRKSTLNIESSICQKTFYTYQDQYVENDVHHIFIGSLLLFYYTHGSFFKRHVMHKTIIFAMETEIGRHQSGFHF